MKITRIKTEVTQLVLKKPLVVTFGSIEAMETIIVKIETDEGLCGYGEASPFGPVTGETKESVLSNIRDFEKVLIGENPLEIERIHRKMNGCIAFNPSAKAGIDIALYDIYSKSLNVPLYIALGGKNQEVESDKTISIGTIENMVEDVQLAMKAGFTKVKLKAGIDVFHDVKAMKAIRESCGDELTIRMDANQGWNFAQAIWAINEMEKYRLDALEQPVAYWDVDGLRKIRNKVNVPLMADESLHDEKDAMKLLKSDAVDVLNIKLMKSKGIHGAMKINHLAESSGVECMIGCMLESPVAISAGVHFAMANKNVTRVDLDSLFAIKKCPGIEGGVEFKGGRASLPDKVGLGLDVGF